MPQNYFEDGEESPAPEQSASPENTDSKTALLPKEMFPDMKPGDVISVKVVRVHEDQYEVEPESSGEEETAETPEMPETGNSMYE